MTVMILSSAHSPALARSRRTWGTSETDPGRYGGAHVRLRIFPPDITVRERRLWRALHVWPGVGFVLAVVAAVLLAPVLGTPSAVSISILGWGTPIVAMWLSVGSLSSRIHELWSNDRRDGTHDHRWGDLDRLVHELDDADADLAAGRIDAATHRARWRAAYDAAQVCAAS